MADLVPIPLELLTRMTDELARTADAVEQYHRDALPLITELREIQVARERARIAADAERLEGRGRAEKLLSSRAAFVVYAAIVTLLGTWLGATNGIAPPGVKLAPMEDVHAAVP